jgi:hypothetical protein
MQMLYGTWSARASGSVTSSSALQRSVAFFLALLWRAHPRLARPSRMKKMTICSVPHPVSVMISVARFLFTWRLATPAPVDEASPQTAEEPTRVPLELLFLVHPMLLKDVKALTQNVVRLKNQVSTATPGSEKARLAQLFLVELVGSLGVDLAVLLPVLDDLLSDADGTDREYPRKVIRAMLTCVLHQRHFCVAPSLPVNLCPNCMQA